VTTGDLRADHVEEPGLVLRADLINGALVLGEFVFGEFLHELEHGRHGVAGGGDGFLPRENPGHVDMGMVHGVDRVGLHLFVKGDQDIFREK